MISLEFINLFLSSIFYGIIILSFFWYLISLLRVGILERKIIRLKRELNSRIEEEKKRCAPMAFINGRIKKIKEVYQVKINEVETKRKFILEKIPFINK